jgi:hypothetical protein
MQNGTPDDRNGGADIPPARSRYLTLDRIAQLRGSDGAIAATLESLADASGRVEVTYDDLAAAAGTSRNTAYRSVQRLKSAGVLSATRRAYRSLAIELIRSPGGDDDDNRDGNGSPRGEVNAGVRVRPGYRSIDTLRTPPLAKLGFGG